MRSRYPLFQSHLDLAHHYWEELVHPGDIVVDATCGNGQDALKLAQLALKSDQGMLYAYDIQSQALEFTKHYLTIHLSPQQLLRSRFILGCHSQFTQEIAPNSVKLIVYNLGYLPKGDKELTTKAETTLESLYHAQQLIKPGGAISLTCYPGHAAGAIEEEKILSYVKQLSPHQWSCCHHRWLNRRQSPSLLLLLKAND